ncbi:MAG: DarT ssDNA thymidine ADP-ribosyltransferase family protein [Fimbriimonadales bacterium]|nr:MAG: hypothetical protein KatS3mg018_1839 [Fimbriimonadales bacterium]
MKLLRSLWKAVRQLVAGETSDEKPAAIPSEPARQNTEPEQSSMREIRPAVQIDSLQQPAQPQQSVQSPSRVLVGKDEPRSEARTPHPIQQICERREISQIVHFTHIANLETVLRHGLLSIQELQRRNIPYRWNDDQRWDGRPDAICTSITFPNYRMFYRYRQSANGEWIVLAFDSSLLWTRRCAFCWTNAASNNIRFTLSRNIDSLMTPEAFERMFAEEVSGKSRSQLGIPSNYTTDPQAEVLFLEPLPVSQLRAIYVYSSDVASRVRNTVGEYANLVRSNSAYFSPRSDWSHWKQG